MFHMLMVEVRLSSVPPALVSQLNLPEFDVLLSTFLAEYLTVNLELNRDICTENSVYLSLTDENVRKAGAYRIS
jgi:hypothetical protein